MLAMFTTEGMLEFGSILKDFVTADPQTYQLEVDQEKKLASLQVDVSAAIFSNRRLSVKVSYHIKDQKREYIATSTKGVVRGTVDDSPGGANKFWSRLKIIWPHAQLEP